MYLDYSGTETLNAIHGLTLRGTSKLVYNRRLDSVVFCLLCKQLADRALDELDVFFGSIPTPAT